jgi:hypothetical protein
LSVFHPCDKYLREESLKEERFILAHDFKDFSPCLADSIALDLRQGKRPWWQRLLNSQQPESRERLRRVNLH